MINPMFAVHLVSDTVFTVICESSDTAFQRTGRITNLLISKLACLTNEQF